MQVHRVGSVGSVQLLAASVASVVPASAGAQLASAVQPPLFYQSTVRALILRHGAPCMLHAKKSFNTGRISVLVAGRSQSAIRQ